MKLGFNTSGNNQTNGRTTNSVLLGKLRNTIGSTSRKFKYCNTNSSDLNWTFNCVFNGIYNPTIFLKTIIYLILKKSLLKLLQMKHQKKTVFQLNQ